MCFLRVMRTVYKKQMTEKELHTLSTTTCIFIMAVCLLLSAYFSATETAFSSANSTRLKMLAEKGNKRAALACKLLGCKQVIPMHWGTFPVLAQDTEAFKAELARVAPGCTCIDLLPGQSVQI